ncbi:MAG: hypothetical protein KF712_14700 [Akkermansiaceae bacterium]|nr:hypothetical protein [Akkermansiaceae bacterium]
MIAVAPLTLRSKKLGNFVETLGNSKQIGLLLMEFEKDYGKYPDATTIPEVQARTGTTIPLGTRTSNDYLRQLLAAEAGFFPTPRVEELFHVPGKRLKRPDGDFHGTRALEKGECGFAYIPGLSSLIPTDMPLLIGPLIPGTDKVDTRRADGKAVALCVDGSAIELKVDSAGHVLIRGKRLLDPTNPIWDGKPPTLVWPE